MSFTTLEPDDTMRHTIRYAGKLVNLILIAILFALSIAWGYQVDNNTIKIVSGVLAFILLLLLFPAFYETKRLISRRPNGSEKKPGASFTQTVKTAIKKRSPSEEHTYISDVELGYDVPFRRGPDEFVNRHEFYLWLRQLWDLQCKYEKEGYGRRSPLARDYWVRDKSMRKGTYKAYKYILRETSSLDPSAPYHNSRLRRGELMDPMNSGGARYPITPWNIIQKADDVFYVEYR